MLRKRLLWKFYCAFLFVAFLGSASIPFWVTEIDKVFSNLDIASLIAEYVVSASAILIVSLFAWKIRTGTRNIWIAYLVFSVLYVAFNISEIPDLLNVFSYFEGQRTIRTVLIGFSLLVLYLALIVPPVVANYLYIFKSDELWDSSPNQPIETTR